MTVRGKTISRMQLTVGLILISLAGFGYSLFLTQLVPLEPEPQLKAKVSVSVESWRDPVRKDREARLLPCVVIENLSEDTWRNVSFAIDKSFYYYLPGELVGGQRVSIPCESFVTKGGNVAFRPATQEIGKLTVFAQLPSGERGVLDHYENEKPPPNGKKE